MGMTCSLRRVTEAEIARLRDAPEQVEEFLFGRATARPRKRGGFKGLLLRLMPVKIESAEDERFDAEAPARDDEIYIDKAWHGLHYLFTGTAWEGDQPGAFLLCGGEELGGDEEIGQGPPRAHGPEAVRRIHAFLRSLSRAELERRFDPVRMTELEIYPDVIWTRTNESPLEYLLTAFDSLQEFTAETEKRGCGLIVCLF